MNLCQEHRDAHRGRPLTKRDKQIGKREEHRPKARMDHCALMEVLYYALCVIPGGSRGELTQFPRMVRVMEGHEVFGPLQLRRIDWNQEGAVGGGDELVSRASGCSPGEAVVEER